MSMNRETSGRFSLPIATPALRPYVTYMSGGRDIACRAILPAGRTAMFPQLSMSDFPTRRLSAPGDAGTPLLVKLRKQAPALYLDLEQKFSFLMGWQEALIENLQALDQLNAGLPADPAAMSEADQQALAEQYLEMMFNYFSKLAELFSTHEHVLTLTVWHNQQGSLSKLNFNQMTVLGAFYNAFEIGVNQIDRILFAEIPAKLQAETMTLADLLGWAETLGHAYFDIHEKSMTLVEAR